MGVIIKDFPDSFDPVAIIEEEVKKCPFCKKTLAESWGGKGKIPYFHSSSQYADKRGKVHIILRYKNKYLWRRYSNLKCGACGCEWDTNWYPVDHSMFEVEIRGED